MIGSYAITGLLLRPFAGRFADRRGRRPAVLVGSLLMAAGGFLYLLPLGVGGLIAGAAGAGRGRGHRLHRRLRPGSSTWRRWSGAAGRVIGLYGLAVWAGLSIGPLFGELIQHGAGYSAGLDLRRG